MNLQDFVPAGQNPALLDGITVDYYGVNSPLTQVSNINTPDPKNYSHSNPGKKNMLGPIEKAIMAAKHWSDSR